MFDFSRHLIQNVIWHTIQHPDFSSGKNWFEGFALCRIIQTFIPLSGSLGCTRNDQQGFRWPPVWRGRWNSQSGKIIGYGSQVKQDFVVAWLKGNGRRWWPTCSQRGPALDKKVKNYRNKLFFFRLKACSWGDVHALVIKMLMKNDLSQIVQNIDDQERRI